jgi:nucleotide-binding universal stress UspA family protein
VLAAIDFSPASLAALARARTLVERGATLHLLHVVASTIETQAPAFAPPASIEELRAQREREARARLDELAKTVDEPGVAVDVEVGYGHLCEEILSTAKKKHADLVVVGTSGKGFVDRLLIGSVAEEVARRNEAPTLVVRESVDSGLPIDRVLVAIDLSDASLEAARTAAIVARRFARRLEAVHVISTRELSIPITGNFDPGFISETTREAIEAAPQAVEAALARAGVSDATIRILGGSPVEVLASHLTPHDLIVCGTHGRSALGRLAFGSVALGLLRRAPCPVIIARHHHQGGAWADSAG